MSVNDYVIILEQPAHEEYIPLRIKYTGLTGRIMVIEKSINYGVLLLVRVEQDLPDLWFEPKEVEKL